MKFRQLNETLDYIMTGEVVGSKTSILTSTFEDRLARAKNILPDDPTFLDFMRMATQPDTKIEGLKEGFPAKIKLERQIPDGIADTTARQEFRRIKSFLSTGPYATIKPIQREQIWTLMLEGMHWKEASTLTKIKDQTLLEEYPGLDEVLDALGISVTVKNPTPKEIPPTTLAPAALKAIQNKITFDAGVSKELAGLAGVQVADTPTDPNKKNPLWIPGSMSTKTHKGNPNLTGGNLLDIALAESTTKIDVPAKPPAKKKATKKKVTKKAPVKKTAPKVMPKVVETDPNVVTQEEWDEMEATSTALMDERNTKINTIEDENALTAFIHEWTEHTKTVMKDLRDTQLNRRKTQE